MGNLSLWLSGGLPAALSQQQLVGSGSGSEFGFEFGFEYVDGYDPLSADVGRSASLSLEVRHSLQESGSASQSKA